MSPQLGPITRASSTMTSVRLEPAPAFPLPLPPPLRASSAEGLTTVAIGRRLLPEFTPGCELTQVALPAARTTTDAMVTNFRIAALLVRTDTKSLPLGGRGLLVRVRPAGGATHVPAHVARWHEHKAA